MLVVLNKDEINSLIHEIDGIIKKCAPYAGKLVIDTSGIKLKSNQEIWEDIVSESRKQAENASKSEEARLALEREAKERYEQERKQIENARKAEEARLAVEKEMTSQKEQLEQERNRVQQEKGKPEFEKKQPEKTGPGRMMSGGVMGGSSKPLTSEQKVSESEIMSRSLPLIDQYGHNIPIEKKHSSYLNMREFVVLKYSPASSVLSNANQTMLQKLTEDYRNSKISDFVIVIGRSGNRSLFEERKKSIKSFFGERGISIGEELIDVENIVRADYPSIILAYSKK